MHSDLFSKQSKTYASYRPQYPEELFHFLKTNAPSTELAWDCGTGNGQAAIALSQYFKKVIATDVSSEQISHASNSENIEYRVLKAESSLDLEMPNSVDLVTVAQAIHWFDLNRFYSEVKRVAKANALIAVWGYSFHEPISSEIDSLFNEFYFNTLAPYWKPQNKLLWNMYKELAFPFKELEVPSLKIKVKWSLYDLMGYFKSWSSTQLYIEKNSIDPTLKLFEDVKTHWPNPQNLKDLEWNLALRVGKL